MTDNKQPKIPFAAQFFAGAIAGVSEISVMYPLDGTGCILFIVVKTRMQIEKGRGQYNSILGMLRQIIKTEGYAFSQTLTFKAISFISRVLGTSYGRGSQTSNQICCKRAIY
jgi:hypothetical protein